MLMAGNTQVGGGKGQTQFQPQVVEIGGKKFTAQTPQQLQTLQGQRNQYLQDQAVKASMPQRPKFDSMLGKDKLIDRRYQIGNFAQGLLADDQGFNRFQQEALREGPSQYAQLMLEQQELAKKDQIGDIGTQYQMGLQNAMDSIASQGGLNAGASERMGAASIRDMLAARQGARRDFQNQRLGILGQDEQNRIGQLQSLTGMEMDRNRTSLQAREFDLRNTLNERDAARRDGQDAWKTQMETWASNRQADAQRSAAGSCFPQGTQIKMADGSFKSIEAIEIGDETSGGIVTKVIQGSALGAVWYDYQGVLVTGGHLVYEDGQWVRVLDSEKAEMVDVKFERLYNLSNEDHMIQVGDVVFSDYDEVDQAGLSWEMSQMKKNAEEINV